MRVHKATARPADSSQEANACADASWTEKFSERFERKPQYLIPILQFVQGEAGYLTPEALHEVARYLRIPESTVFGVATFYAQFHFTPRGRNKVTVCRGTACHVRGSAVLVRELEQRLGIKPGETTPDQGFTLETVACFGACALAPVVVLNEQVLRQQTSAMLRRSITQLEGATGRKSSSQTSRRAGVKKPRKAGSRAISRSGK